MTSPLFTLLVPVKDGRDRKTRLGVDNDGQRRALMAAFARDAVSAALACPLVQVVVVGDPSIGNELGVTTVPDEGDGDLNRALSRAEARVSTPGLGIAVLLADLPCLVPADLTAALQQALELGGRSYVADAQQTGTTLLVAAPGSALDPRFGNGSAAAHLDSGAVPLTSDLTSLRLDVDTTADLAEALRLGVGVHTAKVTADLA